jgi:hypothetical protein
MEAKLVNLNLAWNEFPNSPFGNKALQESTKDSYRKMYRGLSYWFARIGDAQSMIILQEKSPLRFCPSRNPHSIALFIKFKMGKKGTALIDDILNVHDAFGEDIYCTEEWKDPNNVTQLLAAVSCIHEVKGRPGKYEDECSDCLKLENLNTGSGHEGCYGHRGNPRLWRMGNPPESLILKYQVINF